MSEPQNNRPASNNNSGENESGPTKSLDKKSGGRSTSKIEPKRNGTNVPHPTGVKRAVYIREKDLPSLIPLWPKQLEDKTIEGTEYILSRISAALRAERRRGKGSHWSYDINRHIALAAALKAEATALKDEQERQGIIK